MATRRAKAGGETIGGKFFKGGQFISAEFLEKSGFKRKMQRAVDKGAYDSFFHAASSIREWMRKSLLKAEGPSKTGSPPHTHKGVPLRRAVVFHATKEDAVIGPRESVVGDVGRVHEFGGIRHKTKYPKRPFAFPALEANLHRFAGEWAGSIGD